MAILTDTGNGRLRGGPGSGSINYETGALAVNAYANADIVFTVSHTSGLAGRMSSTKSNIIESVFVKGTNAKANGRVKVTVKQNRTNFRRDSTEGQVCFKLEEERCK